MVFKAMKNDVLMRREDPLQSPGNLQYLVWIRKNKKKRPAKEEENPENDLSQR